MQAFDQGTIVKNILLFSVCSSQSARMSSIWLADRTPVFRARSAGKLSRARTLEKRNPATRS
jgi:hypothetical protein